MYRNILVPLDGSPLAERALPYAQDLAEVSGGHLILLRVVQPLGTGRASPIDDEARDVRSAEEYLRTLASRPGTRVEMEIVVSVGEPADVIVEEVARRGANLVVMSTHGRSGIRRVAYGSVADKVMRRADVPVFLIPASCQECWSRDHVPRILVPLDGSPLSREVLDPICELAKAWAADLLLVEAIVPPNYAYVDVPTYLPYNPESDREESRQHLESVAADLQARGQKVRVATVLGIPAQTIVSTAMKEQADLIAMSTHGRGGVSRLLMGSVAMQVVHQAHVPVMIVRPAAVREGTQPPSKLPAGAY